MGQGAYVQIGNASSKVIQVGYWGLSCMYDGGDDGSNFSSIAGNINSGASLPTAGGTQYIEADASGSCALQQSGFNMNFNVFTTKKESATFCFVEKNNMYTVADGAPYSSQTVGGLMFAVSIVPNGDQYYITAMVTDAS